MTKRPTINTLTNTASPTYLTQLNQNFTNIKTQFDNTLSLDGSLPNAMNADLDLNGNDLINGGTLSADDIVVGGTSIATQVSNAAASATASAASATSSAASATTATAYTPAYFDNFTALKADTRSWPVGQLLNTRAEGFAYQVVTSGEHVTTTGGVKLIVLPSDSGYNIKAFGATGIGNSTVDTAALIAAIGSGGRAVFFPNGLYIINFVNLPSNTMLFGEGSGSIIRTASSVRCAIGADSGSAGLFIENVTIKDIRLEGLVVSDGFSEQRHISSWNGVKNLLIDNCQFIGFQGDGVYIGMGNTGGQIRHNVNVVIRNCFFDGVNKDNRQGVSVIDCDGLLIEGCYFTRTTRSNMPGAIDIEPNGAIETIIRDIKIVNNKFYDIGGNVACISVYMPNCENYTTPYQGFLIEGNFIDNASKGILYYPVIAAGVTNLMHDQGVRIVNNITTNTGRSIEIWNAKGALVEGNQFIRGSATSLIGFSGTTAKSIDLTLRNNQFVESGYSFGDGLTIFNVERLTLEGNLFKDCGNGTAGNSDAINFAVNSSSSYVRIVNNIITSPNGTTLVAIQKEATHTFAPETNTFRGNTITVANNSFQAIDNDTGETSYLPIVTGSSTAGTGTYTIQYGRWRKIGSIVFFRLKLTVSAGHTGTGMIQVTLPSKAIAATNNEETTVATSVTGVATTGGQIGLINPAVDVGGVGAVRLYHTTTGTITQTAIPAGAFTITASGFYQEV